MGFAKTNSKCAYNSVLDKIREVSHAIMDMDDESQNSIGDQQHKLKMRIKYFAS
jgi:hypothetical protein